MTLNPWAYWQVKWTLICMVRSLMQPECLGLFCTYACLHWLWACKSLTFMGLTDVLNMLFCRISLSSSEAIVLSVMASYIQPSYSCDANSGSPIDFTEWLTLAVFFAFAVFLIRRVYLTQLIYCRWNIPIIPVSLNKCKFAFLSRNTALGLVKWKYLTVDKT